MGIVRILIGLLLVILPITHQKSHAARVTSSDGLQQSQVAASEVKENLYHDFALVETQEKASDIVAEDAGNQGFASLLHSFSEIYDFLKLLWPQGRSAQTDHSPAGLSAIPRYILYHCLIIPFHRS
ncbi:hypothetical protein SAMN04487996_113198 [Dyadobacter soli]|uniref:Uncharacterized protein n=1 Tax=Dyadobacter soli TaxID=659014 RepID=A0A1G7Q0X3_9BACT|nr:hypothetical protein [Dyadobacter soli]SDF92113.1 hypothetical protein SAMN04487996_113198 [Dyadobacter soli]